MRDWFYCRRLCTRVRKCLSLFSGGTSKISLSGLLPTRGCTFGILCMCGLDGIIIWGFLL